MEPFKYHTDISEDEAMAKISDYLELVGLNPEIVSRYPHELSGGMKQRVMIAMSLLLEPDVLIADEPTTALDVNVQAQIINLLKRLRADLNLSLIFITHDLSILAEISDKVAIMYAGKIMEIGDSIDVYKRPAHPYTRKLLAAIPKLHEKIDKLEFIPGAPPNLLNPPSGCRFHPRCPQATERCSREEPEPVKVGKDHYTACWQR
jgi:peptide/nickel transport system ATP-binding protein